MNKSEPTMRTAQIQDRTDSGSPTAYSTSTTRAAQVPRECQRTKGARVVDLLVSCYRCHRAEVEQVRGEDDPPATGHTATHSDTQAEL